MDTTIYTQDALAASMTRRAEDAARGVARKDPAREQAAAKKVASEFESMFVAMMLKSMRETVGKDELSGGGRGEEVFRSLLDQEYAMAAAKRGGLGLAPMIEQELTGRQPEPALRISDREDAHEDRK